MLEASKDGKYSNITRIKPSDDTSVLDIVYDSSFVPYKKVGAYGKAVFLEIAVNKEADGVKTYQGDDLIDNPNEQETDA
jgi:hypothetical protein